MTDKTKRKFIKTGLLGCLLPALPGKLFASSLLPTPQEIEGPFYPVIQQKDKDFDLTRINGHNEAAAGNVIHIEGQVVDTNNRPIEDATVDLWQANSYGRYRHQRDPNRAPLDPNFQGWAIVPSGANGEFKFKTILPGAYPASRDWMRPPHIHFKISKPGYEKLTTQMYFPGQKLNQRDLLLMKKTEEEREQMIAKLISSEPVTYRYKVVLSRN
ncbi:dioxygenase family protein [Kaarinaea lacus]